jgi:hypothetical protein
MPISGNQALFHDTLVDLPRQGIRTDDLDVRPQAAQPLLDRGDQGLRIAGGADTQRQPCA